MGATIVSFTRGGVNTPGLDAGTFTVPNPATDILIITKMRYPISLLVQQVGSAGVAGVVTNVVEPIAVFSTTASSGAFIYAASLNAGMNYQWICAGL
jgi:hypothetical protein